MPFESNDSIYKKRLFACWNNRCIIVSAVRRLFPFSNCIRMRRPFNSNHFVDANKLVKQDSPHYHFVESTKWQYRAYDYSSWNHYFKDRFLLLSEERCAQQSCVICPQVDVICTCGALYVAKPRWLFYVVAQKGGYCASRTSSTRGGGAAFARGRVVVVNSFYLFLSNDNFDFCFLVYLVSSFPQPPLTTLVVSNTA